MRFCLNPNNVPQTAAALCLCLATFCTLTTPIFAQQPTCPQLAPATTKAFLFAPDVATLRANFNATEFGALLKDPQTEDFGEDLRVQLEEKLTKINTRLGITWRELADASAGELAIAVTQPGGDPQAHALAVMVDVAGKQQEIAALEAKVQAEMAKRNAKRSVENLNGVAVTVYKIPPAKGEKNFRFTYQCVSKDWFLASDTKGQLSNLLVNQANPGGKSTLSQVASYTTIMKRVEVEENATPDLKWFVEPLGLAAVSRAAAESRDQGKDFAKIFASEGFDAILGLGGAINFRPGPDQVVHRTLVHAKSNGMGPILEKGARILQFPAVANLTPPAWVPEDIANCLVASVKVQEGFKHVGGIFNAIQGPNFWEDLLKALETEVNGPRLNVEKHVVAHLSDRGVLLTRPRAPYGPFSEEQLFAVEALNAKRLTQEFYSALNRDPTFKAAEPVGDIKIWRHTPRKERRKRKGRPKFGKRPPPAFAAPPAKKPEPPRALAVANGYLMYATSEQLLREVLQGGVGPIEKSADYQTVDAALKQLGAGVDSVRYFTRLEKSQRVNYELLRSNRMAESKTLLGQFLNEIFESDEPGMPRKQQINGEKLPPFEAVSKYLGNGGLFSQEVSDGWEVRGVFLRK